MDTGLFVKAGWWHRIVGSSPDGKATTACGIITFPSTMAGSIDSVEMGNGCPECVPEKADPVELAKLEAAALAEVQAGAESGVDLANLSAVALRALAAEHGIEVKVGAKKAEILEAIEAAAAPATVELEPEPEPQVEA